MADGIDTYRCSVSVGGMRTYGVVRFTADERGGCVTLAWANLGFLLFHRIEWDWNDLSVLEILRGPGVFTGWSPCGVRVLLRDAPVPAGFNGMLSAYFLAWRRITIGLSPEGTHLVERLVPEQIQRRWATRLLP